MSDSNSEMLSSRPVYAFCVLLALAHLLVALKPVLSEFERNAMHFAGFAVLAFYFHPLRKSKGTGGVIEIALGLIVAASAIYLTQAENAIYDRGVKLSWLDLAASWACIIGATELTRRLTGLVIPTLIVLALSYVTIWGPYVPGVFKFAGLSWETVIFRSIYGDDALFGNIARISSTYVYLFIIFGAFLIKSGAGDFVINISRAVAGKITGGPGLVAVIASGLTGTITGSAVANTASTGVITIPLMKRAGFPAKFAGGVEAASSTGGQLMPPIMGAGAFVMASLTQISYEYIVMIAALPALLYFLSVAFFVRIEAQRLNLPPLADEGITLGQAFREGGASFVIPLGLLIGMLVMGFSPTYAAVYGILAVIASSWLTANPMGPKDVLDALAMGTRNMVLTAILLCAVGLIVNVIATAGIGNTFSLMIARWAGGNIFVAIVLIGLASLVLGMGLPVTAAYIVLATLSAPALAGMISDQFVIAAMAAGTLPDTAAPVLMLHDANLAASLGGPMPYGEAAAIIKSLPFEIAATLRDMIVSPEAAMAALLSAHMIIFWLSQDSNVTPPVALAAFTAAAIAKSPAMATGLQSWKLAKGLYIVPLLFAYTPLLSGDWGQMLQVFFFAAFGIYALAAGMQGCMEVPLGLVLRAASLVAGLACLWPAGLLVNLVGAAVVVALFFISRMMGPGPQREGANGA